MFNILDNISLTLQSVSFAFRVNEGKHTLLLILPIPAQVDLCKCKWNPLQSFHTWISWCAEKATKARKLCLHLPLSYSHHVLTILGKMPMDYVLTLHNWKLHISQHYIKICGFTSWRWPGKQNSWMWAETQVEKKWSSFFFPTLSNKHTAVSHGKAKIILF